MACLCAGCHTPLNGRGRGGHPRRWCSTACRNRTLSPYCKPIGRRPGITREAVCPECGSTFTTTRSRQVCCSARCGDLRRWTKRGKRGHIPKSQRLRILRRDEWRCYLCGGDIPKDRRWPDELSPEIDHVHPSSAGGPTTDDNLRSTHRRCNQDKGDRIPGVEVWVPAEAA